MPSVVLAQPRPLDDRGIAAWAGLLAVHDRRVADTVAIDSALASPYLHLRAAGTRVVGMNRIAARYPALRTLLLRSRDTTVARDAAFALGLAADTASCAALREASASPRTGVAAAWALGEMGERCGPFGAVLRTAPNAEVRAALLRVAGKWTPFPDSVVIDAYHRAKHTSERWAALYALSRARHSAGAQAARGAASDPSPRIRELAARLMTAALQTGPDSLTSLARLRLLVRDRDAHVRIAAVRSIATYGSAAESALVAAWPGERDRNVRVTMAQSIGGVVPASSQALARWWRSDTTHMVRRSLLASAWQSDGIDALRAGITDSLENSPDYRIRIAMIDGPGRARVDRFASVIALRTTDPDARVRAAAIAALSSTGAPLPESIGWPALLEAARVDADVGVRQAALAFRIRGAGAQDVPHALAAYARASADSASDVRETALQLISAAWRRDSAAFTDSTRSVLEQLAPAPEALLRERVRTVTPLAHWQREQVAPPTSLSEYERIVRTIVVPALRGRAPLLILSTGRGSVRIELDGVQTPMTADHLSRLARAGYFRDLRFHRVVPAFVAQGGDPRGDGSGGPGYAIRDELNRSAYVRGAVGMALSGPDTGGSQFFLTLAAQPHLDGHYTVFGRVASGLAVMDALVQGDAIRNISSQPE